MRESKARRYRRTMLARQGKSVPTQPERTVSVHQDTEASKPPSIWINLDLPVHASFQRHRYELALRGVVVSRQPIRSVVLHLNNAAVGQMRFGTADLPTAMTLSDGNVAFPYAFHLNLYLLPHCANASDLINCTVVAQTLNGEAHEEAFQFVIDDTNSKTAQVVAGPVSYPLANASIKPPILLYIEQALVDDSGHLRVQGWATAHDSPVTIQLFTDEQLVATIIPNDRRDDVALAFPTYAGALTSGFSLTTHLAAGAATQSFIRLRAVCTQGSMHETVSPIRRVDDLVLEQSKGPGASTVEETAETNKDPRHHIRFSCESVAFDADDRLSVVGWAFCPIGVAEIAIHVDGKLVGDAELGLPREDVADAYQDYPMARLAGFRFTKDLGDIAIGEHQVRIVFRSRIGDFCEAFRTVGRTTPSSPAELPPPAIPEFQFQIESPSVEAGRAVQPVTEQLTIEGWVIARSGISGIAVLLDGQHLGEAHYGLPRQDVGTAFPDWPNSLHSGYAFYCPQRHLHNGQHTVQISVRAQNGEVLEHPIEIEVRRTGLDTNQFAIRRRMGPVEADVGAAVLRALACHTSFCLVLRHVQTLDFDPLQRTLDSLRHQIYQRWSLQIVVTNANVAQGICALLAEAATFLKERITITNAAGHDMFDRHLEHIGSLGKYLVGFLSAGDELGCDALLEIAIASGLHREADIFYADEIRLSPSGHEYEPFLKPGFSPDLLFSTNYIGRPWFISSSLLERIGIAPRDLIEAGEYDILLRCTECAKHIEHLPRLLCLRSGQYIEDDTTEAVALERAAARRGINATLLPGCVSGTWRVRRHVPTEGTVSIIVQATATRGRIEACINSLRHFTGERKLEVVCVDDVPDEQVTRKKWLRQNADKVVSESHVSSWSQCNNCGAAVASGEFLLFLSEDIEAFEPDWLEAMLEHAQRPEVAVVGPLLLYPDRSQIQQAGMFLTTSGAVRHAFGLSAADTTGYFGLAHMQRNVIAVAGCCMLMRHELFDALNGLDESYNRVNGDVDFCLRARQAGLLTVFTPFARLIHHTPPSYEPPSDPHDSDFLARRWTTVITGGDPYFNPYLMRHLNNYQPDDEPARIVFAGHPLFRRGDIRRVLVMKVDHIGDFVTAIPAIRRLKQIFPHAAIYTLTSPAAHAIAATLDCVDHCMEFEFSHSLSDSDPQPAAEADYLTLRQQLVPYQFDLAVDLRKHPDTRHLLRYASARFLAGYDYMGRFPFLDISLEWDGDRHLRSKRSHISDDLLNLVEAIATAGIEDRLQPDLMPSSGGLSEIADDDVRALFVKSVVAIHPGGSNVMREWPARNFAALIDLLVERNSVNVVLIGGPEEAELTIDVLGRVFNRDAVRSLVGKTSFDDLRTILSACALFVGNNSGPKHIAAALGIPTVGIHSGVVDATEWGPLGPRAVAVQRNMACSPCYLLKPEDCPRGFACMRDLEPTIVHQVSQVLLARPIGKADTIKASTSKSLRCA
jgi:ADP-heptose:LPS heptosyltransferase/GT2 family glycosyltransferase